VVDPAALLERRAQRVEIGIADPERGVALVDHDRRPEAIWPVAPERGGECLGKAESPGIKRHADLGIATQPVELPDLVGCRDTARDRDRGRAGGVPDLLGELQIGSLQPALALDEGDEKATDQVAERRDPLEHARAGRLLPALDDHLAVAGVEGRDHPLLRQFFQDIGPRGGAQHDLLCAPVEPADRSGHVADAAADPAGGQIDQLLDHGGVAAAAERRVEIDHRDLPDPPEAARERAWIAGVQRLGLAADQLDGVARLEIDRGDDHGDPIRSRL
jgi:hypothetical protein